MNKKLILKDLGAENCVNMLQPIKCCDDGYALAILETKQDIVNMAGSLLEEQDCKHACVFVIRDNGITCAYTDEEGVSVFSIEPQNNENPIMDLDKQVEIVKDIIEEVEPHCIGVMQHTENNLYRTVMETIYDK